MGEFRITRKNGDTYTVLFDDEDRQLIEQMSPWCVLVKPSKVYAVRRVKGGTGSVLQMHRLLLGHVVGDIDHVNGNGLDNRRCNLRVASRSENMRNRGKQTNNKSGYKGVSWHAVNGNWRAVIMLNKKQIYLGGFDTPEEAHLAYVAAAANLHGSFARFR